VGGKAAYPIYITLGNIPKALRRKPSMHGCALLGYLSTDKQPGEGESKMVKKVKAQRVVHEALRRILRPLEEAGRNGVEMTSANGEVRRVFPILAVYAADYPEQCLLSCSKYMDCPKCQRKKAALSDLGTESPSKTQEWTTETINSCRSQSTSWTQFYDLCMEAGVTPYVPNPFWADLPYFNIHNSITPDVLHQLYQGVLKHLIKWCQKLCTENELDARIRCLPPFHGRRHFANGISNLTQVSGTERKHMAKILLACIHDKLPEKGVLACRAILDFIYLAQYPSHDDDTLDYMKERIKLFQANKDFFIDSGACEDLNIPKLHSLLHYVGSIQLFGTTDNYNTEMFERLHIDIAKEAWRMSNKRDAFPQMVNWLSRREKVWRFETSVINDGPEPHVEGSDEELSESETDEDQPTTAPAPEGIEEAGEILPVEPKTPFKTLSKFPSSKEKLVSKIQKEHDAPHLPDALKLYLNKLLHIPDSSRMLGYRTLPICRLDTWHQFKLDPVKVDAVDNSESPAIQTIRACPSNHGRPSRFDTVIVLKSDEAESTGLQGTRVGRLRVIFKLPHEVGTFPVPSFWPKEPLAYIEWYTELKSLPNSQSHLFYLVQRLESQPGIVLPLSEIRQACMLAPDFSDLPLSDPSLDTHRILDKCSNFYINNFASKLCYSTLW
jgi:hypothetical protein